MASVPPWMSADTFEYVLQFTEAHEGETNFMYNNWPAKSPTKDVTVGVGLSLRSENDAVRSDIIRLFKRKSDNEPASPEDMRAEFRRVNDTQRIGGNLYTAFRDPSPLYIPKSLMRPNLRENMLTFWDQRGSSANFPDFPTIPAQAQVALMSYNYGARISRAPKMCKAIKDGNYDIDRAPSRPFSGRFCWSHFSIWSTACESRLMNDAVSIVVVHISRQQG